MNVRQRVLEARVAEKIGKNPTLAEKMGLTVGYKKSTSFRGSKCYALEQYERGNQNG